MTRYRCICTYCGHSWVQVFWDKEQAESTECSKCGDTTLIMKKHSPEDGDVFGYNKK